MDLFIPSVSTSPYFKPASNVQVWINGIRRTDAICREFVASTGAQIGRARIEFLKGQFQRPYERYDAVMVTEGDPVALVIPPYGEIWRGTMTGRRADVTALEYEALDLIDKFNACCWQHEYNYRDEVTQARRYPYTAQQIAAQGYSLYYQWKENHSPDDYPLSLDLDTFPAIVPKETSIQGQPILTGLQQVLESIDYRYRIRIDHEPEASIIRAFAVGYGRARQVIRGMDPDRPYHRQAGGNANVVHVEKSYDSTPVYSDIQAEGDQRAIESAFLLSQAWNEVADDYEPQTGQLLKQECVTASERDAVINDWDKFTKEKITISGADGAQAANPNYRKKFENVATRFAIPKVNDLYYQNDDPEHYQEVLGETQRQVKILPHLVQTWTGHGVDPFLVLKRYNDDTLYVKFDGFSVKESKYVETSKPLVDSLSLILAKGRAGTCTTYDSNAKTSVYTVADTGINLVTAITDGQITAGAWLVLGEFQTSYKVISRTGQSVTVAGNATGAGGLNEGKYQKGADWKVIAADPIIASGTTGTGGVGQWSFPLLQVEPENAYTGMYLVIGDFDATSKAWNAAPAAVKFFKIAKSYQDDTNYQKIILKTDKPQESLATLGAKWMIINIRSELKRPFEWIKLNAAWQSLQRLVWPSPDMAPDLKTKRQMVKRSEDYKWTTEAMNYRLERITEEGKEDQYQITYNGEAVDRVKMLGALELWGRQQLAGANIPRRTYTVQTWLDMGMRIGDQLIDTTIPTGTTVTGLTYELERGTMTITAVSRD